MLIYENAIFLASHFMWRQLPVRMHVVVGGEGIHIRVFLCVQFPRWLYLFVGVFVCMSVCARVCGSGNAQRKLQTISTDF